MADGDRLAPGLQLRKAVAARDALRYRYLSDVILIVG